MKENGEVEVAILLSALSEWQTAQSLFSDTGNENSPFGDYFLTCVAEKRCVFFHGGWGKISAAASTQFVIDRWQPKLLVNLGTCGGFEGHTAVGEVVLVDETMVYDIHERMNDPFEALQFYTTRIDLSFLRRPYPQAVRIGRLVSADEDIDPAKINRLRQEFGAVVADWESAAIAWTAQRNGVRVLILRAVSDLVSESGGELYGGGDFNTRAAQVMRPLLQALPGWIRCAFQNG